MSQKPKLYLGVMISSTFIDLEEHRQEVIKIIDKEDLKPVVMENSPALADKDVIESSLNMVRNASAYFLIIGFKYGQTPSCNINNPEGKSLTELEFNEAQRLGLPTLVFIMGKNHPTLIANVEQDEDHKKKLKAFLERAKRWNEETSVPRVYSIFESLEEFKEKVGPAVGRLKDLLPDNDRLEQPSSSGVAIGEPLIPHPPQLYARPPYLASHRFIGREDYLLLLDDWALKGDKYPVCLFEAIGGSGKSILTWNWLLNRSDKIGMDWAGCFWYSFYEKGAETRDFLVHAISYMTGTSSRLLRKKEIGELFELLLHQLRAKPWLLVLDGIERLLVHYHRFDAAHVDDDLAGTQDVIANRDPIAMICDEDSDLFQSFLTASPSKLLISTRLVPRCLVNSANQPLPGLLHYKLTGLLPEDAEILFRNCGVSGNSNSIRSYLKESCDCHPLVIGFLSGLVNRYLPDRSNFDAWVTSTDGGLALNLGDLNLVQKRNHILKAAIDTLPISSRELLSTIAIVSSSFDYRVLIALSPKPGQEKINNPDQPSSKNQNNLSHVSKTENQSQFYLHETITDLEERGLLLFDKIKGVYDLHPVVRGVVVGGLAHLELERLGGRVVDYFSAAAEMPLKNAETLDDVKTALHVVDTYLVMGKLEEAWNSFHSELFNALRLNLETYTKEIEIIRPFFTGNWSTLSQDAPTQHAEKIFNVAGIALNNIGLHSEALCSHTASLLLDIETKQWNSVVIDMINIAHSMLKRGNLNVTAEILDACIEFSEVNCEVETIFITQLDCMRLANVMGDYKKAENHWQTLDPLGRGWNISLYRPGQAELEHLQYKLQTDSLNEEEFLAAEHVVQRSRASRKAKRALHVLKGKWRLKEKQYQEAVISFEKATQMARKAGFRDAEAETLLAQAKLHEGSLMLPRDEAERLSAEKDRSELQLALLWKMISDENRALDHARIAFEQA